MLVGRKFNASPLYYSVVLNSGKSDLLSISASSSSAKII